MGYQPGFQPKLFYHQINLEQRVPQDHLLREIQEKIDFDFIYAEVKDTYGDNGNVSIPPPVGNVGVRLAILQFRKLLPIIPSSSLPVSNPFWTVSVAASLLSLMLKHLGLCACPTHQECKPPTPKPTTPQSPGPQITYDLFPPLQNPSP